MRKISLDALARQQLEQARQGNGRSASTVVGGHEQSLRQTIIAMTAGLSTGEHASPGEATVHVLVGRVELNAGDDTWDGRSGDLLLIPPARHSLAATEDAVVLLTVSTPRDGGGQNSAATH
jgi:quercetin dioxygenase-like cupin family protein